MVLKQTFHVSFINSSTNHPDPEVLNSSLLPCTKSNCLLHEIILYTCLIRGESRCLFAHTFIYRVSHSLFENLFLNTPDDRNELLPFFKDKNCHLLSFTLCQV